MSQSYNAAVDSADVLAPADSADLANRGFVLERVPNEVGDHSEPLDRLTLRDLNNERLLPLSVDFVSNALNHRRRQGLAKGQPLPRALGLRSIGSSDAPFVFDATAGLGTDAFVIAAMGCRVRAVERHPVVFALLADGYARLKIFANRDIDSGDSKNLFSIVNRLSFECGSATEILANLSEVDRPDVVYMDPMYPEKARSKNAMPKKGMQIFRRLIGDDLDAANVFAIAIKTARRRVVVKRPPGADHLAGQPTHIFEGKTARYDMYLVR